MNIQSVNNLDLHAVPDLFNKNFFIPDYQRGYRWGEIQVRQLLEDITAFFDNSTVTGKFYCLQPVAVKKLTEEQVKEYRLNSDLDNNTWYEVIDGQQRLTTIRIILALLSSFRKIAVAYNIHYQTKPTLGEIFNLIELSDDQQQVQLKEESRELDIDSWHVKNAAERMFEWFKFDDHDTFNGTFRQFFLSGKDKQKSVQVIWYELKDGSNARNIFNRLNNNKIELTNSELIRAMFLSDSSCYTAEQSYSEEEKVIADRLEKQRKQAHIVEQWDIIEHKLRDERFWAFISNKSPNEYSNKIELLFDFISKKHLSDVGDKLYTYLYFDQEISSNKQDLWKLWLMVEKFFVTISYWFENNDFYHKIGYLIYKHGVGIIPKLLTEVEDKSKGKFMKESINDAIAGIINIDIDSLSYGQHDDAIKAILLLYNVELCRQSVSIGKFPFEMYKEVSWTLEHIHAQNSEGINPNKTDAWYKWLDENIFMLKVFKGNFTQDKEEEIKQTENLIESLDICHKKSPKELSYTEIQTKFDQVLQFFNKLNIDKNEPEDMHKLSNMTLLSGPVNTKIGNLVFEGKRQCIIRLDSEGKEYIPYGTKRVFLKYHNRGEADFEVQQLYFWGKRDCNNYLCEILSVIEDYLYLNENNQSLLKQLREEATIEIAKKEHSNE